MSKWNDVAKFTSEKQNCYIQTNVVSITDLNGHVPWSLIDARVVHIHVCMSLLVQLHAIVQHGAKPIVL